MPPHSQQVTSGGIALMAWHELPVRGGGGGLCHWAPISLCLGLLAVCRTHRLVRPLGSGVALTARDCCHRHPGQAQLRAVPWPERLDENCLGARRGCMVGSAGCLWRWLAVVPRICGARPNKPAARGAL